jgi:hypothetical protein
MSTVEVTAENRYVAAVAKEFDSKIRGGSSTWYHCERLDNVIHHNSWICKQIGGVDEVVADLRRKDSVTKLVAVSWYVPRFCHTAEIKKQLSDTVVTIE